MQLRSRLQHAWATAVETTGDFIGQALKSNLGSEAWLQFFRLMAAAIAMEERATPVPDTPQNEAVQQYAANEKAAARIPGAQVVLVSVDSINKLRRAYPSYFLESRVFLNTLKRAMAR
jgi:hypothetical protein